MSEKFPKKYTVIVQQESSTGENISSIPIEKGIDSNRLMSDDELKQYEEAMGETPSVPNNSTETFKPAQSEEQDKSVNSSVNKENTDEFEPSPSPQFDDNDDGKSIDSSIGEVPVVPEQVNSNRGGKNRKSKKRLNKSNKKSLKKQARKTRKARKTKKLRKTRRV